MILYILFRFVFDPIYFVAYFLFYRFSGAHKKPTPDSKFDPSVNHQTHYFYLAVRWLEKWYLRLDRYFRRYFYFWCPSKSVRVFDPSEFSDPHLAFLVYSIFKTQPVVIKGLLKDTEAVNKWGVDFFKENYGQTELLSIKRGKHSSNAYTSFNRGLDSTCMSLEDSINNMVKSDGTDEDTLYVNNVTEIFDKHPELVDDLCIENVNKFDRSITKENWLKVNMFMGGRGTGSSLHCAVAGNFFFNVHGRKKWVLIDPSYSKSLKSTPAKDFSFVISGEDIENPSEELKQLIPKYEVILEPGDVLYNPPWWWHYVKNESDFTIGCAVRDHTVYFQSIYNNPMFTLMSPYIWKLNPLFLWAAEKCLGQSCLRKESLKSDQDIVSHLTK